MTNFKKQVFSVVTAGVMMANIATPAFATTIEISGNGSGSDNSVAVKETNTTTVTQNNTANVTNTVKTNADTGDNKANYNTGGNTEVKTGEAKVTANVTNNLNTNTAKVDCCAASDTEVKISGNGAKSDNEVDLTKSNTTTVTQNNTANVTNDVDADADTGGNKAGKNTGGDVSIETGKATVKVGVATAANVNSAVVGGGHSASPTPKASFWITGNGAGSDNEIAAELSNSTTVDQENDADIDNDVDADADSGDNEANFNTGGEVEIMTGPAEAEVAVDNAVNFNFADVDCGCEFDVTAKIAGNGAEEDNNYHHKRGHHGNENSIDLTLGTVQTVAQDNDADLDNDVDVDGAETGDNEAGYNTGEAESDPSIETGPATSKTEVSNSGNVNSVGDMIDWPDMPEVDFDFNFAALWAMFSMSN